MSEYGKMKEYQKPSRHVIDTDFIYVGHYSNEKCVWHLHRNLELYVRYALLYASGPSHRQVVSFYARLL